MENSDKLDHKTRALAYNSAMADLHDRYPSDDEAAVFYALSQIAVGTIDKDPNYSRQKNAAAILNEVLQKEPDHPGVAHYLIHSFDYPALANSPFLPRIVTLTLRQRPHTLRAFSSHLHPPRSLG